MTIVLPILASNTLVVPRPNNIIPPPRAQRENPILARASSASTGPFPRSAPYAKRSGIGPERALEANTKTPRAQRESPILPRASSASAGPIPRSAKTRPSEAGSVRSEPWSRTPKSPRAQRENLILPRASSASAGPFPRSAPYAKRSGIGPQRALEANNKNPSRTARKPHPPQSLLSERRTVPAERPIRQAERDRSAASLGGEQQKPLAHSAKTPSSPEPPQRAQDRSRGAPHTPSGAGSVQSEPWRRTPKSLAHSAKAPSFPEPPQRAQDRSRGAPQPFSNRTLTDS